MRSAQSATAPVLAARHLSKAFPVQRSLGEILRRTPARRVVALDDVTIELGRAATLAVVGETGSGKSTLAHCLVRLVEPDAGTIEFDGEDVVGAGTRELRAVRRKLQLVYQDPYSSLNPQMKIGRAIAEPARIHGLVERGAERTLVRELLEQVGLGEEYAGRYPRQLSGGQRQRVAIARALAVRPTALIADEAVSALDVSIQAQIINLLLDLQDDLGVAIVFITHQLGVVANVASDVAVMYLGRIVEHGPLASVFGAPHHPYSAALLEAHPTVSEKKTRRAAMRGEMPSALALPTGCRFRTRCPLAERICAEVDPPAVEVAPGHTARCHVLAPSRGAAAHNP